MLVYRADDGARLAYRAARPEAAARGALLLLHGAASNGTRWWRLCAESALRGDHLLLRPDLRGHGASIQRRPATMERWADDLAALLDHAGVERAFVAGHCLGANLAVHFVARHPQRCAGLVLVEPMLREALCGTLARLRPWSPLLRLLVAVIAGVNAMGLRRRRFTPLDLELLDRSVQEVDAKAGEAALHARFASPRRDLETLPTSQYLSNLVEVLRPLPLAAVRCPALALLSTGRLMADPQRTRTGLAALPGAEIVEIDAQHWIPTEQPDAMRACIDDWVARTERGSPEL